MTNHELPEQDDFSRYWVRMQRKSDGRTTTGAGFDSDAFAERYGEEAASAYGDYAHFSGNPPTSAQAESMFKTAIDTLKRIVGVDPSEIARGKSNARIEDE